MSEAFTWGSGGQAVTPEGLKRRREQAQWLAQNSGGKVTHWAEGAGKIAQALASAYVADQAQTQEAEAQAKAQGRIASILAAQQPGAAMQGPVEPGGALPAMPGTGFNDIAAAATDPFLSQSGQTVARLLLEKSMKGQEAVKPIEINGRLVDPVTFKELANFSDPKAPTIQDFLEGDFKVQKQFDPATGGWKEVGRGRAFAPTQGPETWRTVVDPKTGKPLYQENSRGERKAAVGGDGLFGGTGLDAQALNQLVSRGVLSEQQALEVAAGKALTLEDGSQVFASPQALAGAATGGARPGMVPLSGPKPTEGQALSGGFADRMSSANEIIDKIGKAGTNLWDVAKSNIPLVGNSMVSQDYQSLEQAQRNFVNAILRKESGAAIGKDEFQNASKQYFPQPGDSSATIAQKARARADAIASMKRNAGSAYAPTQSAQPAQATPAGAPQVGEIVDGYRYKGGNPADPNSWSAP